jgi:hypothetical protein
MWLARRRRHSRCRPGVRYRRSGTRHTRRCSVDRPRPDSRRRRRAQSNSCHHRPTRRLSRWRGRPRILGRQRARSGLRGYSARAPQSRDAWVELFGLPGAAAAHRGQSPAHASCQTSPASFASLGYECGKITDGRRLDSCFASLEVRVPRARERRDRTNVNAQISVEPRERKLVQVAERAQMHARQSRPCRRLNLVRPL